MINVSTIAWLIATLSIIANSARSDDPLGTACSRAIMLCCHLEQDITKLDHCFSRNGCDKHYWGNHPCDFLKKRTTTEPTRVPDEASLESSEETSNEPTTTQKKLSPYDGLFPSIPVSPPASPFNKSTKHPEVDQEILKRKETLPVQSGNKVSTGCGNTAPTLNQDQFKENQQAIEYWFTKNESIVMRTKNFIVYQIAGNQSDVDNLVRCFSTEGILNV